MFYDIKIPFTAYSDLSFLTANYIYIFSGFLYVNISQFEKQTVAYMFFGWSRGAVEITTFNATSIHIAPVQVNLNVCLSLYQR